METADLIAVGAAGVAIFYLLNKKSVDTAASPGSIFSANPSFITPLPNEVIRYFQENPKSVLNPINVFTSEPNVYTPLPNAAISVWEDIPISSRKEILGAVNPKNVFSDKVSLITPIPNAIIRAIKGSGSSSSKSSAPKTSYNQKTGTLIAGGLGYSVAPEKASSLAQSINRTAAAAAIAPALKAYPKFSNPYA